MQKVVIIGDDSYLAGGLIPHFKQDDLKCFTFDNWKDNIPALRQADYVLNFAIHPDFMKRDMDESEILDIQLANALKGSKARQVLMSSRKVYGTTDECVTHKETDSLSGFDFYSKNKIKTEKALKEILGDNAVILRIANILGEPVARTGYKTFIGWISENYITTGKLVVTQNETARKDFIPKTFLHRALAAVVHRQLQGTYNVSSGFGTTVHDVLAGYVGSENLVLQGQSTHPKDQFILDASKLTTDTDLSCSKEDINSYLSNCHRVLNEFSIKYRQLCDKQHVR